MASTARWVGITFFLGLFIWQLPKNLAHISTLDRMLAQEGIPFCPPIEPLCETNLSKRGDMSLFLRGERALLLDEEVEKAVSLWQQIDTHIWRTLRSRAVSQIRAEKFAEAMRYYQAATILYPTEVEAWALLADMHRRNGDLMQASTDYLQAAQLTTDPFEASMWQGLAYTWQGEYDLAEQAYITAQQLHPDEALPFTKHGYLLYWEMGQTEEAIQVFETAVSLDPTLNETYIRLITLYLREENLTKAKYWLLQGERNLPNAKVLDAIKFEFCQQSSQDEELCHP